jgi:hypothetical protein
MFPILKQKKFQDLMTGKIISVVDQFEDVAILEGRQRINVKKLLDSSLYEEYIDPETFLNGPSLMTLAEKIRSIPNEVLDQIRSDDDIPAANESLVIPYDEEEEKNRLLEKARQMNPSAAIQNTIEQFRHLMDESDEAYMPVVQPTVTQTIQQEITSTFVNNSEPNQRFADVSQAPIVQPIIESEDPIHRMFKNIKRKNNFSFSLEIEDKIPRPDFIEMMEDSYEVSLIDYLAQEFTNKILANPNFIKEKIKDEITKLVYPDEKTEIPQPTEKKVEIKTKSRKKNDSPITN